MLESIYPGLSCRPSVLYRFQGDAEWKAAQPGAFDEKGLAFADEEISIRVSFAKESDEERCYDLDFHSARPAQVRLTLRAQEGDWWHLIPANIHGNNNMREARRNEYMMLTYEHPEDVFCSPFWELRADRVPQPVVMLISERGTLALSVNPYTDLPDGSFVRNGIRAELPGSIAVSAGYTNDPVTYTNHCTPTPSTAQYACEGYLKGRIWTVPDRREEASARIIRSEYELTREVPSYRKTTREAAQALLNAFLQVSWNDEWHNYTNCCCHLWKEPQLKSWRQLPEIGWTAGGILAYPFLLAQDLLQLPGDTFAGKMSGSDIADEIADAWDPEGGMINDVTRPDWKPDWKPNPVNGWWAYLGLTSDCHSAYTNGSAVYYLLKMLLLLKEKEQDRPAWRKAALDTLDTVISLQRQDGNYGYTYSRYERKVLDWNGFAGCWFAAAMPLAFRLTGDLRYLDSCRKAMDFYGKSVRDLCCTGSPMDTWKSVDQEGNLAFIRAAKLMHEVTGEQRWLKDLRDGAHYQFLWQYGFKARPECPPLKDHWNSCGGSITSVSNPHVHPMGVLVIEDLYYLSAQTGDPYYADRARDQYAWAMQCLELYPDVTGYGRYGLLTERYCPSDGLTIEQYDDGTPSSLWFSYNGWAGANMLEAMLEALRREERQAAENCGDYGYRNNSAPDGNDF